MTAHKAPLSLVAQPLRIALALALWCGPVALAHAGARVPAAQPTDELTLALGRGIARARAHDPRGVLAAMGAIDFAKLPASDPAQRAALLAAHAALESGEEARFAAVAQAIAQAPIGRTPSVWTRWIAAEAQLRSGARTPDLAALSELPAAATDDAAALNALASLDTTTSLGRDLAGAATLRLATRAAARGEDPAPWLARVPVHSLSTAAALAWQAQRMAESGATGAAIAVYDSLARTLPGGAERRRALLGGAALVLESGRWDEADARYRAADSVRGADTQAIAALRNAPGTAALWQAWHAGAAPAGAWALEEAPLRAAGDSLVAAVLAGAATAPAIGALAPSIASPAPLAALVPPPALLDWTAIAALESQADAAGARAGATQAALQAERQRLGDVQVYLSRGLAGLARHGADLERQQAILDSLQSALAAIDARLRGVRDAATVQVLARTRALLEQARAQSAWAAAMRRIELGGAAGARARWAPAGEVHADSLLARQQALDADLARVSSGLAAAVPTLLADSYAQRWRPLLLGRTTTEDSTVTKLLAWARRLRRGIEGDRLAAGTSETLERLAARAQREGAAEDSLLALLAARRDAAARGAIDRALAALASEREGLDYGLAAAAYARSVRLAARDSVVSAPRVVAARSGAADADAEQMEDAESARLRAIAMPRMRDFLARYPDSPARGEMRFRLADLEMLAARADFHDRMAAYLKHDHPAMALPVLAQDKALALYRSILTEDPAFPHRDAVLFDAGMILADAGDPAFERDFRTLVTEHPTSPYCGEAWLRLGDARFQEKRYLESAEAYARAAAAIGVDPTLAAIADYKRGWSHFNEDRFLPAADAFRAVLDRYEAAAPARPQVDLRGEAEDYLVIALAGAGGAPAYTAYFDSLGPRPYGERVLLALAQHERTHGALLSAVQADQAFLGRFPRSPQALLTAQRWIATLERADRGDEAQAARIALAPRFTKGSDWSRQQRDSLVTAGDAFAYSVSRFAAAVAQDRARQRRDAESWKQALALDEILIAGWPHDPDVARFELGAGEACARLDRPEPAMDHYARAADVGADSIAVVALWQRVALVDGAYERARVAGAGAHAAGAGKGPDSLARAVLREGDAFVKRFPQHAHASEVTWRESQLALAHGWNDRAVADLGRFLERDSLDARAPVAATQRAEAFVAQLDFARAETAYGEAARIARRAGRDTLARQALAAMPVCAYRGAEALVAADSTRHREHAEAFAAMAARYPADALSPLAQYRASLAWLRADEPAKAVAALRVVTTLYPKSPYARDAQLRIAQTLEGRAQPAAAADAYLQLAVAFPADDHDGAAALKAADLYEKSDAQPRADSLRLAYVRHHPEDVPGTMAILEVFAHRDLAAVDAHHPLAALLPAPARHAVAEPSHLAAYLKLAAQHPALASRSVIAQCRFVQAEESRAAYEALRLTQPLPKSIASKKRMLDSLLARYRRGVDAGDPLWAHASALRMGQVLIHFGDALQHAERPADLTGADRAAYDEVLRTQAQAFDDRGVGVLTQLLRQARPRDADAATAALDPWASQAQSLLWERLADRFQFRPEAEVPLVDERSAAAPEPDPPSGDSLNSKPRSADDAPRPSHPRKGGLR